MSGRGPSREFLGFLASGGVAAAVNFGSRILYDQWLSFSAAIVLAHATGMATAFVLMRLFVFTKAGNAVGRSLFYFTLINLASMVQIWIISMLLARYVLPALGVTAHAPEIAHAVGVAAPVFTSYIGHKRLSFRGG